MYSLSSRSIAVPLITPQTVRKIRYGVIVAHIAVLVLPIAILTVIGWFAVPEEKVITVALYDPALDNVVENPSPDPDPSNPIPPSGPPDPAPPTPPAPEPVPQTQPVAEIPAPAAPQPLPVPRHAVNTKLPDVWQPPKPTGIKQPKIRAKAKPKPAAAKTNSGARKTSLDPKDAKNIRPVNGSGNSGPRGANADPGHTVPGGQRGNSGYDAVVASRIERMWVTPDKQRLGGCEPRVLISLTIAPDGRVTDKRIVAKSGILAMDESVSALLANLRTVIPPYDGKEHTLTFYLRANND